MTQDYVCDDSDIEENNRWKWAIAIYEKLREFVILGNTREFFATEQSMFKPLRAHDIFECEHGEEDYNVALPRFFCCRRRKARLLIIDQILQVLRVSYDRYHKADTQE